MVFEDEFGLTVDLTQIYGGGNDQVIKLMTELENADISGCCKIVPADYIDSILNCTKIMKFQMIGCEQFSEYQIIDICTSLPNLTYFDASNCKGLQFVSAYVILCNAKNLKVFRVEPKYDFECKDWAKLKQMFPDIEFGDSVNKLISDV